MSDTNLTLDCHSALVIKTRNSALQESRQSEPLWGLCRLIILIFAKLFRQICLIDPLLLFCCYCIKLPNSIPKASAPKILDLVCLLTENPIANLAMVWEKTLPLFTVDNRDRNTIGKSISRTPIPAHAGCYALTVVVLTFVPVTDSRLER